MLCWSPKHTGLWALFPVFDDELSVHDKYIFKVRYLSDCFICFLGGGE